MQIKMTVIYGEDLCENLKQAFDCTTDEEFLGAFKAIIRNQLMTETISDKDISVKVELV